MPVALPSAEYFFLLMAILGAVVFSPLLGLAIYSQIKRKSFEWGAYWALGTLFAFVFTALAITSGIGVAIKQSVVASGICLILLAPAYALTWRATGYFLKSRERCKGSP